MIPSLLLFASSSLVAAPPPVRQVTRLSDTEIASAVDRELFWSPFVDAADVHVKVEDGVATLEGEVDSWAERNAARDNAYEGGATYVRNHLLVRSSEASPSN